MKEAQILKRCPGAGLRGVARLPDYRIDFTISAPERWRGGGCADIVVDRGSEVWGLLYEMSADDLNRLDTAEGSRYRRVELPVTNESGMTVRAFAYEVVDKAPSKCPAREYLNIIKDAARSYHFPKSYTQYLDSIEVQG